MTDFVELPIEQAYALAFETLVANGLGRDHAAAAASSMVRAQQDDCQSHGLYRTIMCVKTLRAGQVDPQAVPQTTDLTPSAVLVDAKRGFSLLAFERGLPLLVEKAKANGVAVLVIRNCHHFSALWPEVEAIADQGLVGLSTNPSHAWVVPPGGTHPVLGTNPIAMSWPRPDRRPLVFDFATSAMARGDLELYQKSGQPLPQGAAVDANGQPTTDPTEAMNGAMLPFGGHKGFALSLFIELIAGPLIGDMTSAESLSVDGGAGGAPLHGQIVLALDPATLGGGSHLHNSQRAELFLRSMSDQGTRLPSERRYRARDSAQQSGKVRVKADVLHMISQLKDTHPDLGRSV